MINSKHIHRRFFRISIILIGFIICLNTVYPNNQTKFRFRRPHDQIEVGIGLHNPQSDYEKYVDSGLSLRFVYSYGDRDFQFIRYDASIQYLGFKNDVSWENLEYNGVQGPSIKVKNSEQSFALLIGPRIMSPTNHGAIRPYIGVKGGLFFFTETITWEWDNDFGCWFCDDDDDDDSYTDVIDSEFHFGWMLEMGSNVIFAKNWGLDFGIQYYVIPGIKRPETIVEEYLPGDEVDIGFISKKINANYVSIYIGMSVPFDVFTKK